MRFDDRLKTALMQPIENNHRAKTQWTQLIDLLSQKPENIEINLTIDGLLRLRELMVVVDEDHRISGVQSVMGRLYSPPLLQLLAGDTPMVALSAIRASKLTDNQWAGIIPNLPTRARGFLRNRDDLGPKAKRSLALWASADFILPANDQSQISNMGDYLILGDADMVSNIDDEDLSLLIGEANIINELDDTLILETAQTELEPFENNNRQRIDEIVEKIESLRSSREQYDAPQLPLEGGVSSDAQLLSEIYFATDDQGTINWVDGVPRGALVGTSLADPSYDNSPGPDASGAAAFRQRIALENARMKLCGSDILAGDWRVNAAPFFDTYSGRFKGYKGLLRRPNVFESASIVDNGNSFNSTFEGDSSDNLQQLIHELRTPLGAVLGFAEIIEQQLFGPASSEYRLLAKTILEEGNRLLSGLDDLNVAAKIDSGNFQASFGLTNVNQLMRSVYGRLDSLLNSKNVTLNIIESENLNPLMLENDDAERLFVRLLSALIVATESDEILTGRWETFSNDRLMNQFSVTIPAQLRAMSEQKLLESGPENNEENTKAPLLGLGFSLRLVRNLADNIGGSLHFDNNIVILQLPAQNEKIKNQAENNID